MIPVSAIVQTVRSELERREIMARATGTQKTVESELKIWRAAVELLAHCEEHGVTVQSGRQR